MLNILDLPTSASSLILLQLAYRIIQYFISLTANWPAGVAAGTEYVGGCCTRPQNVNTGYQSKHLQIGGINVQGAASSSQHIYVI